MKAKSLMMLVLFGAILIPGTAAEAENRFSFGGHVSFNLAGIQMPTGSDELLAGAFSRILTLSAGVDVQFFLAESWALTAGIQIDRLGGRYVEDFSLGNFQTHEDVKAAATYLTFPIFAKFIHRLNNEWSLLGQAGPYLAFFLGGRAQGGITGDEVLNIDEDIKDYASNTDFGLILGVGIMRSWKAVSVTLDIRYRWGLVNGLNEDGFMGGLGLTARNSAITVTLGILTNALTNKP